MSVDLARRSLRASADATRDATTLAQDVARVADRIADALASGGTLFACGNGGSAADAQHLAAELLGRFASRTRAPLAATALSADGAVLTGIANDHEYAEVFARQVRALARAGDVVVAISTSGASESVVRALAAAPAGVVRIALTGPDGGRLADVADLALRCPGRDTPAVQAAHIAVIHAICAVLDARFAAAAPGSAALAR